MTTTSTCVCGESKEYRAKLCMRCRYGLPAGGEKKLSAEAREAVITHRAAGMGARRIALRLLADGLTMGKIESVVRRVARVLEGTPPVRLGRPRAPGGNWDQQGASSERKTAKRKAELAAMETARRAIPRCGYCDTAAPGRPCIECGMRRVS